MIFYIKTSKDENIEKIIKEKITGIGIFNKEKQEVYYIEFEDLQDSKNNNLEDKYNKKYNLQELKEIFENKNIKKISTEFI